MSKPFENRGGYFEPTVKAEIKHGYDGTIESIHNLSIATGRSVDDIERMLSAEGLLL
jgi:hypothetical protein